MVGIMAKSEKFKNMAALKKHENAEGKAMVAMEKKMNEKDTVVRAIKKSMKTKNAGKKINKSV